MSQTVASLLLLSLLLLLLLKPINCNDSSLEFVHIFFRHGERMPATYLYFPTDPAGIEKNLRYEAGELTNVGMWQEYTLGANLREDYAHLVNLTYRPSLLRVNTGVDNRTVVSALLALASFLPPVDEQVWNSALRWQPIPTVTEKIIDHVSFNIFNVCPQLRQQIVNSDIYWNIFDSMANLTQFLELKTGLKIPNLFELQLVIDGLVSRDSLRNFMPYPEWADNRQFIDYLRLTLYKLHNEFITTFINEIGGWHYDQIVGAMNDFVNRRSRHKIVIFSGHDTNLLTLSQFLKFKVNWHYLPNYASYVSFELHHSHDEYIVKVYFHNDLNKTKHEVHLADCLAPCTFNKFANLGYKRISNEKWMTFCRTSYNEDCAYYQTLSGVMVVAAIILVAFFISALWSCLSYRKKYIQLNDSETRPLL